MVVRQGHVGVVLAVVFGLLEVLGGNLVLTILRLLILQTLGSLFHLDHLLQPPYLPPWFKVLAYTELTRLS